MKLCDYVGEQFGCLGVGTQAPNPEVEGKRGNVSH